MYLSLGRGSFLFLEPCDFPKDESSLLFLQLFISCLVMWHFRFHQQGKLLAIVLQHWPCCEEKLWECVVNILVI